MPAHHLQIRLSQELELKQHSLKLLEERMQGSEAAQLSAAVTATQAELDEAQAAVAAAQERKKEMATAAKVGGWGHGGWLAGFLPGSSSSGSLGWM